MTAKSAFDTTVNKVLQKNIEAVSEGVLDIAKFAIEATPVDNHEMIGSWSMVYNKSMPKPFAEGVSDYGGASALAEIESAIGNTGAMFGNRTYRIVNTAPYALTIEEGLYSPTESNKVTGGFSTQAPKGILRVNEQNFADMITTRIKEFNK